MKKIILSILIVFTMISCNDDDLKVDNQLKTFNSVIASLPNNADTRTTITDQMKMTWLYSDCIGIYSDIKDVEEYYPSWPSLDTFTGKTIEGNVFYAYYPYHFYSNITGMNQYNYPDNNDISIMHFYLGNEHDKYHPLVATSSDNHFQFKHICGYLDFGFTNKELHSLQYNARLIANNGEAITGWGSVNMNDQEPVLFMDKSYGSNIRTIASGIKNLHDEKRTTVLGLSASEHIYIPLPVGNYEKGLSLKFSVEILLSDNPLSYVNFDIEKKTGPLTIKRGEVTHLPKIDVNAEFETGNCTNVNYYTWH